MKANLDVSHKTKSSTTVLSQNPMIKAQDCSKTNFLENCLVSF